MSEPPPHPHPDGPPPAAATPPARRRPLTRRVALIAVPTLLTLTIGGGLTALALSRAAPRWWARVDPADPRTIATAEAVENGLATALTQVRPAPAAPSPTDLSSQPSAPEPDLRPAPWKLSITEDQANAWLNVRLRGWVEDQADSGSTTFNWPPEVGQLQVRFQPGVLHLGAEVTRTPRPGQKPKPQTLAAAVRPELKPDGSLWMTAQTVAIGRLAVPAGWLLPDAPPDTAAKAGKLSTELSKLPQTAKLLAAFGGKLPVLSRPVIKLADGRRVRLLDIEPGDGTLVITFQTEHRADAAR